MSEPIEFLGEKFAIAERIGLMPLMRFAKVAKSGVDSDDLDGLAAMYDLIQQCVSEEDWVRFEDHADKMRADGDQLMGFVQRVVTELAERPTQRPSDSSDGPQPTPQSSGGDSSSRVVRRLEEARRPDLALAVVRAQEARAASAG